MAPRGGAAGDHREQRARAQRARPAADPLLHRHGLGTARGDVVQRSAVWSRHRHLGAGRLLDGDRRLHPLLDRLRRDGPKGHDRGRFLLVHVVRVRPRPRTRHGDRHRRRLHALRRRCERRHGLLRPDEHPRSLRRLRHGLADLRVLLHRAHVPGHLLPCRVGGEDPRHRLDRRAGHPDGLRVRRGRKGRRPGRNRLGGAQSGRDLQRRRGGRGFSRVFGASAAGSDSSPPSGRGSASRWRRTTPRRRATRRR